MPNDPLSETHMTLAAMTRLDCWNLYMLSGLERDPELRDLIERLSHRDETALPALWEACAVRGRLDLAERIRRLVHD